MASTDEDAPATCRDVEERFGATGHKGKVYRKYFPGCECECRSVSAYSPRVVGGDEVLVRLVLPGSVKPDLKSGEMMIEHEVLRGAEELGLSVVRRDLSSKHALMSKAEQLARKCDVQAAQIEFATILCSDVRRACWDGRRVYCVLDSATKSDPSHADILRDLSFPPGSPNQKTIFRVCLEHLARGFVLHTSLSDVFI